MSSTSSDPSICDRPIRVLTVGMKPAVNEALAELPSLEVTAMTQGQTVASQQGRLKLLPYQLRSKMSLTAARRVRKAIAATRPDLVQTYGSRPLAHTVMAMTGMRNRPRLVTYRGITSVPSKMRPEDWLTYLSPLVDAHACESQASMDGLLSGGVRPDKCFITYNCLTRAPQPAESRDALTKLGIQQDAFLVAMVANFRRVKGADLLLEAARRLTHVPNLHFLLLGEVRDPEVERLAALPEIAGRVTLAGFRQDAMDLAGAADVFAMPSRAEALCVALLEAMSMGVCPLVSDAGGMKEAVRDNIDGLVFPREQVASLAATIEKLSTDRSLVESLGKSAKARFAAMFGGPHIAARFDSAYRQIIGKTATSDSRVA